MGNRAVGGRGRNGPGHPPALAGAYAHCGRVAAAHGKSYHLAARLLPPARRPAAHALYAFARSVDDLVDLPPAGVPPEELSSRLRRIGDGVATALEVDPTDARPHGPPTIPHLDDRVAAAFLDTARTYRIDPRYFSAFLRSMRMDIAGTDEHVAHYRTMDELGRYMHGSAAVIGLQMLPVLGAGPEAAGPAAALGVAFQLTNFLRDVGEDLDRGRIYLPLDDFAEFGVDADRLAYARRSGRPDAAVRAAMAHFIDRTRDLYRQAEPGAAMLPPRAGRCVRAATAVYSEILTAIERSGYRVFDRRIVVPRTRRLVLAARAAAGGSPVGPTAAAKPAVRTPSPAPAAPPRARDPRAGRPQAGRAATGRR